MKHFPRARVLAAFLLAFAFAGCLLAGDDDVRGDVTGAAEPAAAPPALLLKNGTNRTVCYFAAGESGMAVIDFDFRSCTGAPTIAPGRTARVPYEDLSFYAGDAERAWVAWRVKERPDRGYASFKVALR